MDYREAREYLDRISAKGNLLGLTSITLLLKELGNPQDRLRFVHIAGTNGKGSVMSFLEQTLIGAGYRVGRYLSPVLFCYEEKIQVNKEYISKDEVARQVETIRDAVCRIEAAGGPLPTIFEVETAMAFLHFAAHGCDLVLLETGMGGREDATNVVTTSVLEIISSISMDHMEFLGKTIGEIAWNKAGIIKPGTRVVSDHQSMEAEAVLIRTAQQMDAKLTFVSNLRLRDVKYGLLSQQLSYASHENIQIHLPGTWQISNAALALEAVDALRELGYDIPEPAVREGFDKARWEGRFEILHESPLVIMDGAHNPDAAAKLRRSMDVYFPGKNIFFIFGVFSDKEYDKIIDVTAGRAVKIWTVQTKDHPRALPAAELAEAVRKVNPNAECAGDVKKAIRLAMGEAGPDDVIILFGSLSWLYEARDYFKVLQKDLIRTEDCAE